MYQDSKSSGQVASEQVPNLTSSDLIEN